MILRILTLALAVSSVISAACAYRADIVSQAACEPSDGYVEGLTKRGIARSPPPRPC